jgi:hypothetical protein
MKCPRDGCKNKAIYDNQFGVLPCKSCQNGDSAFQLSRGPEFYNLTKQTRIVADRDKNGKDIIQPWIGKDWNPNPDFVKAYPDMAKEYFSDKQLKDL